MILYTLCNSCLQSYQLLIEASDVHLLKSISDEQGHSCPCPRLCGGAISLLPHPSVDAMSKDPRLKDPIHISGKELFMAVKGMGLPDEIPKHKSIIEILLTTPIKNFDLDQIDGKFYLHSLEFQNGVTLHLSSGAKGAQVLKLTVGKANGSTNHR